MIVTGAMKEKHRRYWMAHQGHWCGLSWVLAASRNNEGVWRPGGHGTGCSRQGEARSRVSAEEDQNREGQLQQERARPDHVGP